MVLRLREGGVMREKVVELLGILAGLALNLAAGFYLYGLASAHQYEAFWGQAPGALMLYGGESASKYAAAYRTAAEQARVKGFIFSDPELISPNEYFNLWKDRWERSPSIVVSADGRYLMIDELWSVRFADGDLECIMAHELGHVIDFQRLSEDHEVIRRSACLDSQQLADTIGRYLCGYERYNRIMRKYIKNRPMVPERCN